MDFLLAFVLCISVFHGYKSQNPEACKENEEYTDCGSPCNMNCTNYDNPKIFCIQQCKAGCFCKPGFVRDFDGKCIHPSQCPRENLCGKNEEYSECHDWCNYCHIKQSCKYPCLRGCDCRKGYTRDRNRKCIPFHLCPKDFQCSENEEYMECPDPCNYCYEKESCKYPCEPGCDCKKGYTRNEFGICIPTDLCPKNFQCRENEEYVECSDPCNYCYVNESCKYPCEPGCDCKKGHTRNEFGRCIPVDLCAIAIQCRENEEYLECPDPCNYCHENESCKYPCEPGCDCKNGYTRNETGICIPADLCPSSIHCGVNEEYSECPDPCNLCYVQESCKYPCKPGCDCKKGYTRDETGTCTPSDLCSKDSLCGENEEYSECPDSCNYCDIQEPCKYPCDPGCDCKKGYHRDQNGSCIPADLCTKILCKENETFLECGSVCPPKCDDYLETRLCSQRCLRGCFCKRDYVMSRNGTCILSSECPGVKSEICPQNQELYDCMPTCNTCKTYNSTTAAGCSVECRPGCFCKKGLIKRSDGMCVTPAECPKPMCRKLEEYLECGSPCPVTCDNYRNRALICHQQCIEGCFCIAGYIRHPNGDCVKPRLCPSVTSGSNQSTPFEEQPRVIFRHGLNDEEETDHITKKKIQDKTTTSAKRATPNTAIQNETDDQTAATTPTIQSRTDDHTATTTPAIQNKTDNQTSIAPTIQNKADDQRTTATPTIQSKTDEQFDTNSPTQKTEPTTSIKGDTATASTKLSTENKTHPTPTSNIETTTPFFAELTQVTIMDEKTTNSGMKISSLTASTEEKSLQKTSQTEAQRNETEITTHSIPTIETVNSTMVQTPKSVTAIP